MAAGIDAHHWFDRPVLRTAGRLTVVLAGAIDTGNPVAVVLVLLAIPIFLGVGLWCVVRPAQAYRASHPLDRKGIKGGAVFMRAFGCVFLAMSVAFTVAFLTDVISN